MRPADESFTAELSRGGPVRRWGRVFHAGEPVLVTATLAQLLGRERVRTLDRLGWGCRDEPLFVIRRSEQRPGFEEW